MREGEREREKRKKVGEVVSETSFGEGGGSKKLYLRF
jgi:hypothetical protein